MKRIHYVTLLSVAVTSALTAATLPAQGNISTLGFGYPLNGLSTRAAGTSGALAEFDLLTPRNPSSLFTVNRSALAVAAEPEFRTLTYKSVKESNTIQRVPLIMAAVRLTPSLVVSVSSAGFLDRNFTTKSTGQAVINSQVLATNDIIDMRGSISDLRLAVGYRVSSRFSVGIGGHVFTGTNKLSSLRQFEDSSSFGQDSLEISGIQYFGKALSFGGTVLLPKGFSTAASYRRGFGMEADNGDSVLTRARVPDRLSGGVMYRGIPGATFAVNVDQNKWSNMQALGSSALETHDATNVSGGAEVSTGKIRGTPVLLRAGAARNTLPFGLNGGTVSERRFSLGSAIAITNPGRDQAVLDFSVSRANRTLSGSSAKEGAWMLGIGIQIRP
ncbi:MAG: hypothetical protein ABJB74_04520 [Gemmatimonas sp.]